MEWLHITLVGWRWKAAHGDFCNSYDIPGTFAGLLSTHFTDVQCEQCTSVCLCGILCMSVRHSLPVDRVY